MDLKLLDSSFLQTDVIDSFKSLVWTERYNNAGDVTLVVPSTPENQAKIVEGSFLAIDQSKEVMLLETISDEKGSITAVGKSLVAFFANRIYRTTWQTAQQGASKTGTAGAIALDVVQNAVSISGVIAGDTVLPAGMGSKEVLSNLALGKDPGGATYTMTMPFGDLFTAMKQACDADSLGFTISRTVLPNGNVTLTFRVYRGVNRTSAQGYYQAVIFEPANDSFTGVKLLRDISAYKTHAYAFANGQPSQATIGSAIAPGASNLTGWQRRTMMVDASDITATDYPYNLQQVLTQKAADALANNNYVRMADGQVVPQNSFIYGIDYNLGDVIELRGSSTTAQTARITEYIRTQDNTGERAYPTLSVIS